MLKEVQLKDIKAVGPKLLVNLQSAGINTIEDLLNYFPRRYDDYSDVTTVAKIRPGLVSLKVKFTNIKTRRVKRSLHITDAEAYDDTGNVRVVWFNQPYRAKSIDITALYILKGNFEFKANRLSIINPTIEVAQDFSNNQTIMATYPERSGLKSTVLRKVIQNYFNMAPIIKDDMPTEIINKHNLPELAWAYKHIHMPDSTANLELAKKRFAFEELFILMFASELIKRQIKSAKARPINFDQDSAITFVKALPFELTNSQRKVIWQIYKDINSHNPMNRLVEGDVGSGKTVVATMAILMALKAGMQACLIAPTEILANQHYLTIKTMLDHTEFKDNVVLLTGSLKANQKKLIKDRIKNQQNLCLIGTHALMQKDIIWNNLGLVVVDEQHRFGVKQRQALHTNSDFVPHNLCLTATPIPRSLALTVYGELDISILDKAPSTKAGYTTKLVSPNSTAQMYDAVKIALTAGRQAYIVCPLVTESDLLKAESAENIYQKLSKLEFKNYRVGLIHGKLKPQQKDEVMNDFKKGQIDVLVSTTVIEVGVDVPNATEMVILNADRFGLAQLHQLRGRVGRGQYLGHCYLVLSDSSQPSKRMRVIESTNDGFELAQYDLDLRGPGAIYGTKQHGELDLKFVNLADTKLIAEVKQAVLDNINNPNIMLQYTKVANKINKTLQLTYLN
jgi:ATP-dependent DNA helicase RecG